MTMHPFVTVNCAMSADGKIAGTARRQVRISSPEDMDRVKALRASVDAILVGVGTVLADDPHLTIKGRDRSENPLRVVMDSHGRTPIGARVLDDRADTLIVTGDGCGTEWDGASTFRAGGGRVDVEAMLDHLGGMGVRTLLVEGGGEVIWSFVSSGRVDRFQVFVGSIIIGGRTSPTPVDGEGFPDGAFTDLVPVSRDVLGDGVLLTYEVRDAVPRG